MAAAMLMSSLSALPPVSAAETVMTDDLLSVQGIPVEHTPEIALYGAGNTSPDEQAAYPEDIYSSTMGYDVLNDAQKAYTARSRRRHMHFILELRRQKECLTVLMRKSYPALP